MKKKLMALVLACTMAMSLAACGGSSSSSSTTAAAGAEAADSTAGGDTTAAASDVELPKNIEIQVPASAGGGTDVTARALSDYINKNGGVNTTIVNNTDGSGVVAMETVRSAKADGSKILFYHSTMCIKTATGIYDYSAADDFKVIGCALPTEKGGYVLVVPASSGITDVDGFVKAAQDAGGKYMIGVETGGSSHIMAAIMSKALGIELDYVEAGADTDKLTQLVGGSIDCALVNANQAKQYIEAGKVNALACFSATDEGGRNSVIPDVPSFYELGYEDCIYGTYFFVLGPKDMDDATAEAIHDLYAAAAQDPDTASILENAGMGLEFIDYADGQQKVAEQQEQLTAICQEFNISKK